MLGYHTGKSLAIRLRLFSSQIFSRMVSQHFPNLVHSTHTSLPMKMEEIACSETSDVGELTQNKAYNNYLRLSLFLNVS